MRPNIDFDETRTASHMPSQAGRRLLIAACVAEGHVLQSWDVPGAYLRAPNNPNLRVVMKQPPRADGTLKAPGKICVLQRAIPGDKSANQAWDTWRDHWLSNWGWTKVLAEPSMFHTMTANGIARMEADNDDFFVIAPTLEDLDNLARPLEEAWQIKRKTLMAGDSIEKNGKNESGPPDSFQHVGLKITRLSTGGIKISNPKKITKF